MENREIIIETALKLFCNKGYNSVGVQEIATKSGVTKPTLYHYFGNKEGLLRTIINRYATVLNNTIEKSAVYNSDLPATLYKIASAYFDFVKTYEIYYQMHLSISVSPKQSITYEIIKPHIIKDYKNIEELFIKASNDHGNMKGRHKNYAISFIGILNVYASSFINENIEINNDIVFKIVHQFMHGIYS